MFSGLVIKGFESFDYDLSFWEYINVLFYGYGVVCGFNGSGFSYTFIISGVLLSFFGGFWLYTLIT